MLPTYPPQFHSAFPEKCIGIIGNAKDVREHHRPDTALSVACGRGFAFVPLPVLPEGLQSAPQEEFHALDAHAAPDHARR
jgi:hypothetical protein